MAVDFYVAPNGNDAWSGRRRTVEASGKDGPFASLERARRAVRELLPSRRGRRAPIRVQLRGGLYRMNDPVEFAPEDSGGEASPVIYEACPRETPVLSAGRRITGWTPAGNGWWAAPVPTAPSGEWVFRQLWVNGARRRRPRLPRDGEYPAAAGPDPQASFIYQEGHVDPSWHCFSDVEIVFHQFWTEGRFFMTDVDAERRVVRLSGRTWRPVTWCTGYHLENVREALREPGQWYLDRSKGLVLYWPLPGEDVATAEIMAPAGQTLLSLDGDVAGRRWVRHLAFRGLTFSHTEMNLPSEGFDIVQAEIEGHAGELLFAGDRPVSLSPQTRVRVPAAVQCRGARNVTFEEDRFVHTGGWGLELSRGCRSNRVEGSLFTDLGAGAIRIGEPQVVAQDHEEAAGNHVTDNRILGGCEVYLGAPGIWIGQSSANRVAHNEVSGAFEWGISTGWSWNYLPPGRARDNVLEYNWLHDLRGPFGLHGAIYFLGVQPGTTARCNRIERVAGCGFILDNACVGIVVEGNLVAYSEHAGLNFNYNDLGNIIRNNVFAFGRACQFYRFGDVPADWERLDGQGLVYQNIFYWQDAPFLWKQRWPDHEIIMDYNLLWRADRQPVLFNEETLEQWREHGLERHSMVADPLFVDPEKGDFRLSPESPAWALGFAPLDLASVGPRARGKSGQGKEDARIER